MGSKLFTVDDVAERYQVKPGTVRVWVKEKRIKFQKISRLVRFTEEDIQNGVIGRKRNGGCTLRLVPKKEGKK
jgi:excisionase family DNA binding protein